MTRLSRDADDSTSIGTQEDDGRTLARLRGWDVVLVTYDIGVSGALRPEDRPGFRVILDNLLHIDVVIARSIDRFTRQTGHFASLVERLDGQGTTLVDVQGQVDLTSPYGRFVTTIMVAFAQMEREVIQGRILRSRVELRRAGRWLGGAAPYGYRIVPDGTGGKRLEVDPKPAAVLREVIRRVTAGVTLSQEVYRLNGYTEVRDNGEVIEHPRVLSPGDYRKALRGALPPPHPGYSVWTYSALHEHLRSEVLRGVRVVGKRKERRAVRDDHGAPVRVGPALVDDEKWYALQAALDAAAQTNHRPRRKSTLLLTVGWCPNCDATLHYNSRGYKAKPKEQEGEAEKRVDLYTCPAVRDPEIRKSGICPGVSVSAERLESHVGEWVLTKLGHFEYKEHVRIGGSSLAATVRELEADIDELAASLVGLRGAAKAAVLSQLEARQEALEEAQKEEATPERWEWVPTGRTIAEEWHRRDTAEKRLLLLSLNIRADVAPANGARRWDPSRVRVGFHFDDWAEAESRALAYDLAED
ncbi:recombinase family protein [Streptomyces sp. NPDC001520]|uniref:recombinase family protein n=1 Tax=Streptomyces sp. NPDC001520 TaxID=3364581 RepID=UPI00367F81EB